VPLGGTAVGTGINTPLGFPQKVIELLAAETELPITEAKDHFEAQANRDGLVEASGALRTIAVSLTKINNDLRWMGSGPNTGLGELHIPDLQPGSSIMPGKVNPVVPEATLMVCARVIGNDATVAWAGASGSFELNVAIPVMGTALLESIRLLSNAMRVLADKTIDGLEANLERAAAFAGMSPSIVTPLNKLIGYEAAAKIAKHAVAKGITVREAVIDLGYVERGELTEEQLDAKLDLLSMTHPADNRSVNRTAGPHGRRPRRPRTLGLVLTIVGAGFAVTALACSASSSTSAEVSWPAVAPSVRAPRDPRVTALVGWTSRRPALGGGGRRRRGLVRHAAPTPRRCAPRAEDPDHDRARTPRAHGSDRPRRRRRDP
jgi:hypothetical protein